LDTTTSIDAVLAERGSRYGDFMGHAEITQATKDVWRNHPGWNRLAADQKETLEMIAHKIGRALNGDPNYDDTWVDLSGYPKLVADRLQGKKIPGVTIPAKQVEVEKVKAFVEEAAKVSPTPAAPVAPAVKAPAPATAPAPIAPIGTEKKS
jgi:hypothetical protein